MPQYDYYPHGKLAPFFAFMDEYPGRHAALGRQRPYEHLPLYPLASRRATNEDEQQLHQLAAGPSSVDRSLWYGQWPTTRHQPVYRLLIGEQERLQRTRMAGNRTPQQAPRWKAAQNRAELAKREKDEQRRVLLDRHASEAETAEIGARIRQMEDELYESYARWRVEAASLTDRKPGRRHGKSGIWEPFGVPDGDSPLEGTHARCQDEVASTSSSWSYGGPNVLDATYHASSRDRRTKKHVDHYTHLCTENTVLPPYTYDLPPPTSPRSSPSLRSDETARTAHHTAPSGMVVLAPPLFTARPLSRKYIPPISPIFLGIIGKPPTSTEDDSMQHLRTPVAPPPYSHTQDALEVEGGADEEETWTHPRLAQLRREQGQSGALRRGRGSAQLTIVQDELSGMKDKYVVVVGDREELPGMKDEFAVVVAGQDELSVMKDEFAVVSAGRDELLGIRGSAQLTGVQDELSGMKGEFAVVVAGQNKLSVVKDEIAVVAAGRDELTDIRESAQFAGNKEVLSGMKTKCTVVPGSGNDLPSIKENTAFAASGQWRLEAKRKTHPSEGRRLLFEF